MFRPIPEVFTGPIDQANSDPRLRIPIMSADQRTAVVNGSERLHTTANVLLL